MTTVSNDDISKWASEFTDDELAEKLARVAEAPRSLLPAEKSALFREAARRIGDRDKEVTVDLGHGFTFVQRAPTGELRDADGLVSDGLTLASARVTVAAVAKFLDAP